jgi:hypothetical protein
MQDPRPSPAKGRLEMRFQPYFSDWLARFYLSGQWLLILFAAVLAVGLFCWVFANDGAVQ